MPENITINAAGFKGVNSDLPKWDLPKEFATYGLNFRLSSGKIDSVGSVETLLNAGANFNAAHILSVNTPSAEYWMSLGNSAIKVWDGATETDISSVVGYATITTLGELNWTSCMLGKIPVVNNPQHVPEYWDDQVITQVMQPLMFDAVNTWAAKGFTFKVIRSHKNFLFAINLSEGGIEYPNSYRWSHPADENGLPASWDETDVSFLAGRDQIGGDTGVLIDGRTLRNSFCLYSEFGATILDPSNDEFVWKERPLSGAFGLINKNCILEIKGVHFFISDGDIIRNDGNILDSAIYNVMRKRLQSNASGDYYNRSFAVRDTVKKEMWFCVPENGAQFPNIAYVYNWKEDNWAIHELPYTEDGSGVVTLGISHAAYGLQASPPLTYADMGVRGETYENTSLIYASQTGSPLNSTVVGVDQLTSDLITLDPNLPPVGTDTDFILERTDFAIEGHNVNCTVVCVYPYIDSTDPVIIQIGSQNKTGGAVTWSSEKIFDPSTDKKVDILSTGLLHAWRIKSVDDGRVSMSGMLIEYEIDGER